MQRSESVVRTRSLANPVMPLLGRCETVGGHTSEQVAGQNHEHQPLPPCPTRTGGPCPGNDQAGPGYHGGDDQSVFYLVNARTYDLIPYPRQTGPTRSKPIIVSQNEITRTNFPPY